MEKISNYYSCRHQEQQTGEIWFMWSWKFSETNYKSRNTSSPFQYFFIALISSSFNCYHPSKCISQTNPIPLLHIHETQRVVNRFNERKNYWDTIQTVQQFPILSNQFPQHFLCIEIMIWINAITCQTW